MVVSAGFTVLAVADLLTGHNFECIRDAGIALYLARGEKQRFVDALNNG